MKKYILLSFLTLIFSVNAFAHQAFMLISSEKKTIKLAELIEVEKTRTLGKKENSNLTFTEKEIRLVILTGPEDDMLSYRVQGLRNPNLIVPSGATLKILFVNKDVDMRHDVRFGHVAGEFTIAPEIAETAGSEKLTAKSEDNVMQAEEIVIKTSEDGAYKYFCSVRRHAKGGMWGNILVGVNSTENLKVAPKTEHIHSAEEEKEEHQHGEKPTEKKPEMNRSQDEKKSEMDHENMAGMNHGQHGEMKAVTDLGAPMAREGSGTSWLPDSSPMHAYMKMFKDGGMLMAHGNMFVRYKEIGSDRDVSVGGKGGRNRFDAPSMFMLMYSRPLTEKSQIGFRAMLSLDPLLERGYGYPLLYQSGELYRGEPIHDRQHPHDLFSELSASYSYKINENQSFFVYAGLPGEPALGAPAFMHRVSAMNNPDAPISHHWQDSTHITYGVLTAGYNFGKFKLEASAFKGEEPNENRWDIDKPKLDSFSGRFSWNPTKNFALQISHGYLKNPEPAEPEIRILRRTTASAIYNKKFDEDTNWASSFVWGQNYANGERTNAFLFESSYDFNKNSIFGRLEQVQKSGHELVLDHEDEDKIFRVGAYSLGYLRELTKGKGIDVGIGAMATLNTNPSTLVPYYGGTKHGGWQIFLRFRPSAMN
jgi:plastocyanin